MTTPADVRRYRANWQGEVDSAAQYRAMAASEAGSDSAKVYESLAAIEEKHASFWESRLEAAGAAPGARKPRRRARPLIFLARPSGAKSHPATHAAEEHLSPHAYAAPRANPENRMHRSA